MKVALAEVTNGLERKNGLPDDFEKYKQDEPSKNFGKRTGTVIGGELTFTLVSSQLCHYNALLILDTLMK